MKYLFLFLVIAVCACQSGPQARLSGKFAQVIVFISALGRVIRAGNFIRPFDTAGR